MFDGRLGPSIYMVRLPSLRHEACIYGEPTVRHLTGLHSRNQDAAVAHRHAMPTHVHSQIK